MYIFREYTLISNHIFITNNCKNNFYIFFKLIIFSLDTYKN